MVDGYTDQPMQVPCGTCVGCRLDRARSWAVRCMHEAQLHRENCFITLTYDPDQLPDSGSLVPEHFVNFMKRLRKKKGPGIRFFHCGEYGEKLDRPHHHALLFGCDFPDKRLLRRDSGPSRLWESQELRELWGHGFVSIGEASIESAGYIARYALKKVNGKRATEWYNGKVPEYLTMSRRPGLGKEWIQKYHKEVYPRPSGGDAARPLRPPGNDGANAPVSGVRVDGKLMKPPRYYDETMLKINRERVEKIKKRRREESQKNKNNTPARMRVREELKRIQTKQLKREMEMR